MRGGHLPGRSGAIGPTGAQDGAAAPSGGDLRKGLRAALESSAYGELFSNRSYRRLFVAGFVSSLGDWLGLFAMQVLVGSVTGGGVRAQSFALGGVLIARLLPGLLFGPVAGVLADRYDRKRLMVTTDFARAALFVGIAFTSDVWALLSLSFLVELAALLFMPAKDASLPVVVRKEHLTQANQLNLLVAYGTLPLGAAAAALMAQVARLLPDGWLLATRGEALAVLLNAVTFLVSAAALSGVDLRGPARRAPVSGQPGLLADLRDGLAVINRMPLIRALILGVVGVGFGVGVVVSLGPLFVEYDLGAGATGWFTLMMFVGGGLIAGMLLTPTLGQRFGNERFLMVTLAATGAIVVAMTPLGSLALACVLGAPLGAAFGMSFVLGYTLLHEHVDDRVRARTFATFYTSARLAMFAALGLAPFVSGLLGAPSLLIGGRTFAVSGVRVTILIGGLVALGAAVAAARGIRRALQPVDNAVSLPPGGGESRAEGAVFIAFEGVEGAGKSTQVRALADALRAEGREVVMTREPGGPRVAEDIRGVLLDPAGPGMHPRTEALLYAAARAEHVQTVILPALARGAVVLCDRFIHSSLAYQAFGRGLNEADVFEVNRWATGGLLPDVVVLLRLDPQEGLSRVSQRRQRPGAGRDGDRLAWTEQLAADRIELEELGFHRRVAAGFMELVQRDPARFVVVDAEADVERVTGQVRSALARVLPPPGAEQAKPPGAVRAEPEHTG